MIKPNPLPTYFIQYNFISFGSKIPFYMQYCSPLKLHRKIWSGSLITMCHFDFQSFIFCVFLIKSHWVMLTKLDLGHELPFKERKDLCTLQSLQHWYLPFKYLQTLLTTSLFATSFHHSLQYPSYILLLYTILDSQRVKFISTPKQIT